MRSRIGLEAGGGGGGGKVGGASVGGGSVGRGSGVFVGGAGVVVSVGIGVFVAVAVAVGVRVGVVVAVAVAVFVGGTAVAVGVGGTAVFVAVTALIASVVNKSALAVAAKVGNVPFRKDAEPLAATVTTTPMRPVNPMTMSERKTRFLMMITPGKGLVKLSS